MMYVLDKLACLEQGERNSKKRDSKKRKEVLKLGSWEDGKRGKKLHMASQYFDIFDGQDKFRAFGSF